MLIRHIWRLEQCDSAIHESTVVYTGRATDEDHVGLMSVYPRSDQRILGVALSMVTSILEEYVASIYKVE
jgi:hypothetical protein